MYETTLQADPVPVKKEDFQTSVGVVQNSNRSKVKKSSCKAFREGIERRNRLKEACYDYRQEIPGAVGLGKKLGKCFQGVSFRDGLPNPWFYNCRDKSCPFCRTAKQTKNRKEVQAVLKDRVNSGAMLSFVTLTQRGFEGESPKRARRRVMKSWAKMMRQPYLRRSVSGFYRCLEVVKNGSSFHYHIHALVEVEGTSHTRFKRLVQSYWSAAGGGFISAKRKDKELRSSFKKLKNMAWELSSYLTKGNTTLSMKDWVQVAVAGRGKRDYGFGGIWAKVRKVFRLVERKKEREVPAISEPPSPTNEKTGEVAWLPDGIYRAKTLFRLADRGDWSSNWAIELVKWAMRWSNHPDFGSYMTKLRLVLDGFDGE